MPFTILFDGRSKVFPASPAGYTPELVKEAIVGAFDLSVNDGTFSLRRRDGTPGFFDVDLAGDWDLILIRCEFC